MPARPAPPVLLSHPSSLDHDTGPHPERAARIVAIERELAARDWLGCERVRSSPASLEAIQAIHPGEYVEAIRRVIEAGGGALDVDTLVSPGSWDAALHAAGGAVELVDRLLTGASPSGASLHRPPGHHAETARAMGFCLFNNAAVAARHALDAHGAERVLILDWDVHHGNGTNDIFHASPEVLYVSIHQSPLYPGTGPADDVGEGDGRGYTLNLPVPPGSGDELFCSLVEHLVAPVARAFAPRLILLSAGYDAHADDPLGECTVSDGGYSTMTATMRRLGAELDAPVGLLLEGGYDLGALARSVAATIEVMAAPQAPPPRAIDVHPDAAAARARLVEPWRSAVA